MSSIGNTRLIVINKKKLIFSIRQQPTHDHSPIPNSRRGDQRDDETHDITPSKIPTIDEHQEDESLHIEEDNAEKEKEMEKSQSSVSFPCK